MSVSRVDSDHKPRKTLDLRFLLMNTKKFSKIVVFSFKLPRLICREDYVSLRHFDTFKPYLMPFSFNAPCQFTTLLNFLSLIFGLCCLADCNLLRNPLIYDRRIIYNLRLFDLRPYFQGRN